MSIFETIKTRRSVRTFSGEPLRDEDARRISEYAKSVTNPYGINVDLRVMKASECGISSSVVTGEDTYIAGKVKRIPHAEEAYGFSLERVLLFAESLGVGNVWLAGTFSKNAAKEAMQVSDEEILPAVSPLGYAAEKMSLRETVMRRGTGADKRIPFEGAN